MPAIQSVRHAGSPGPLTRRRFLRFSSAALLGSAMPIIPVLAQTDEELARLRGSVKALMFDVFGTVVDWHGSIVREGRLLSAEKGYDVDWDAFATRWRAGYGPAMQRVRDGELPWTTLDELHRMILDEMLPEFGLEDMNEAEREELNRVWHRLSPWPDAVSGLNRLKARYVITTLSNGNVAMLMNMAKNAGLPWDAILSAELAEQYKPAPEAYLKAADLLDLPPKEVMLVAAHPGDLRAAAAQGFRTGYVHRPLERGAERRVEANTGDDFDVRATDFLDLSRKLGA